MRLTPLVLTAVMAAKTLGCAARPARVNAGNICPRPVTTEATSHTTTCSATVVSARVGHQPTPDIPVVAEIRVSVPQEVAAHTDRVMVSAPSNWCWPQSFGEIGPNGTVTVQAFFWRGHRSEVGNPNSDVGLRLQLQTWGDWGNTSNCEVTIPARIVAPAQ